MCIQVAGKFKLTSATVFEGLAGQRPEATSRSHLQVSRDPDFAAEVKDVVGFYLNPPENAIVLNVDEKTSIQALERTHCRCRCGRAARLGTRVTTSGVTSWICTLC